MVWPITTPQLGSCRQTSVNSPKKGCPAPIGKYRQNSGNPKILNFRRFWALYGRRKAGNDPFQMPQGLASFSTPGEPIPEHFFFRPFTEYFKAPWIFDLALPMAIPWDLGSNRIAHLVEGSTHLQDGRHGSIPSPMGSPLVKQGQISRIYRNIQKTVEKKVFRNGSAWCGK